MILRSTRVLTPAGLQPATLHVHDGRIEKISGYEDADGPLTDYSCLVIMPGLVDSHVHVNEPGRTEWEGFETATRAAAAGGVTTIVDMPLNSIPATTTLRALETKKETLDGKCWVDVALWGGVIPGNTNELLPMLAAGAAGFKCFLVPSGVDEFPHVGLDEMRTALQTLRPRNAPLLVHAEAPEAIREGSCDGREYRCYLGTRPAAAEDRAIEEVERLCRETGGRAHIVHLSSANGAEAIARAKRDRIALSAETTPHYLHLAAESIPDSRTEFKCAPPIRENENRERLWRALADGVIDLVVSDHSPSPPDLKKDDFLASWGGIASLQFTLPIVWSEASRRGHSVEDLVKWMCEGPARLAGLDSRKGSFAPGSDADILVWNPDERFTIRPESIYHRHKLTPYAGETLSGVVKATYVRGELVYRDREHVGRPRGVWVRP